MEKKLYVPDVSKWLRFFENRPRTHFTNIPRRQRGGSYKLPIIYTPNEDKQSVPAPKVEMTSQTQAVIERAEAEQKRTRAIKRKAGDTIVRTKKIKRGGRIEKATVGSKNIF